MEGGKDRYHHEEIKKQCDIGDEAGRPVVDDHEGNDEDESQQDRPGGHCHRIRAERRPDTLLRYDREVDRKRCGTQGDSKGCSLILGERACQLHILADGRAYGGDALDAAVHDDGKLLPDMR